MFIDGLDPKTDNYFWLDKMSEHPGRISGKIPSRVALAMDHIACEQRTDNSGLFRGLLCEARRRYNSLYLSSLSYQHDIPNGHSSASIHLTDGFVCGIKESTPCGKKINMLALTIDISSVQAGSGGHTGFRTLAGGCTKE